MVNLFCSGRNSADAEADVADFCVGELGLQLCKDLLFLKREFLNDCGVARGYFERAAADAAWVGVFGYGFAGRLLPGGGKVGGGLDAVVLYIL